MYHTQGLGGSWGLFNVHVTLSIWTFFSSLCTTMLIDVAVSSSSTFNPKLPPCIAKFDHDELVLIELQGTLDIECGEDATRDGQFVGKLNLENAVCGILSVTDDHLTDF